MLVQHLVTVAIGGGFTGAANCFDEVRTAYAYRDLTQQEFDWALAFVERGGASLAAYPDYHRVALGDDGVYRVPREDLVRRHRNNVGTIVANATINVAYMTGGRIGAMEESFISRLKPGDVFTFGGRALELVRVRDMTAYVKRATSSRGAMPQWAGSRMPLSSELADATLDDARARERRHLRRARDARRAAAARIAGEVVGAAGAGRAARRSDPFARRSSLLLLSVRGAHGAYRTRAR